MTPTLAVHATSYAVEPNPTRSPDPDPAPNYNPNPYPYPAACAGDGLLNRIINIAPFEIPRPSM